MMKHVGFIRNINIEEIVESSYQKAVKIPDDYVIYDEEFTECVQVQNMSKLGVIYKFYGAYTEWACCTCKSAESGNICKHQIKVLLLKDNFVLSVKQSCMELYNASLPKVCNVDAISSREERDSCSGSNVKAIRTEEKEHVSLAKMEKIQSEIQASHERIFSEIGGDEMLGLEVLSRFKICEAFLKHTKVVSSEANGFTVVDNGLATL